MATASAELIEIATRHAVHYEKLKSHEVKSFDNFLKLLNEDLIKQLSRSDITLFTRARLEKQLALVREIIKEIYQDYHSEWKTNLVEVGKYEAEFEKKALDRVVINREFVLPTEGQIAAAVFTRPLSVNGIDGGALLDQFFEQLPDNTIRRVEGAIRLGFAQGQTTQQVINRIRGTAKTKFSDGLMALSKRDADIITRTALQHVSSQSRQATWERNSDIIKGIKIVATLDSRTSAQCFPGQTLVKSAGALENVFRANYSGEFITITASSGKKLEGTPNHPVLTTRGFLPLNEVKPGDKIISAMFDDMIMVNTNEDIRMPSMIGELFDFFSKDALMDIFRKTPSAIDFYGDGTRCNGQIDIISINSELWSDIESGFVKNIINEFLCFIKLACCLDGKCSLNDDASRNFAWDMSSEIRVISIKNGINATLRSSGNSGYFDGLFSFIEKLDDSVVIRLDVLIYLASLEAWHNAVSLKKRSYGSGGCSIHSSELGSASSFSIEANDIISIGSKFESCHVYTISTNLGFYTANGFIVKNCRSLDGKVYPIDKAPMPPYHHLCRTTTSAVIDSRFSVLDEGATRSSRNEDGKVVKVDAEETYYSWLKKQSANFQDSIIGKTRGKLLRDGGLSAERFAEINLNKDFSPATIPEMREMDILAFERAGL